MAQNRSWHAVPDTVYHGILHAVVLASCGPALSTVWKLSQKRPVLEVYLRPATSNSNTYFLKIQVTMVTTPNQRNKCEPAWNDGGAHTHTYTFQTLYNPVTVHNVTKNILHRTSKQESMSLSKNNAGLSLDIDHCVRPAN